MCGRCTGLLDEVDAELAKWLGPLHKARLGVKELRMAMQTTEPSWLILARTKIGIQEVRDNSTIIGWAKTLGGFIASYFTRPGQNAHTIPWCGLFADYVLTTAGFKTPGDKSLAALNWQGWGQGMVQPGLGAVLVFVRPGGGHVGFYVGEDASTYFVLGGNESNQVEISRELKTRCVAIRWPYEVPPQPGPVMLAANGKPVTSNEA